ncbi:hypothetical protein M0657_008006 [Pyricularia oryzae]|nr:hypothetical protein M9X92_007868 [Pyricularia oryzae]KAI7917563.1 hypothetical protein M0657_008006 [Pyricularia oryzae]
MIGLQGWLHSGRLPGKVYTASEIISGEWVLLSIESILSEGYSHNSYRTVVLPISYPPMVQCSSGHGRQLDKAFCVKLILGCVPMNLVFILVGPDSNRYNIIRQY